jgi:hypothetical protein
VHSPEIVFLPLATSAFWADPLQAKLDRDVAMAAEKMHLAMDLKVRGR